MTLGPNNDNIQAQTTSSWDAFMASATASSSPPTASPSLASTIQEHQSSSRIPDDISLFSVNDILSLYKHDTDLLKHVLAAKAQEDRRKTAEEFRQVEETRLRFKFTDFEMDDFQTPPFSSVSNQGTVQREGEKVDTFTDFFFFPFEISPKSAKLLHFNLQRILHTGNTVLWPSE